MNSEYPVKPELEENEIQKDTKFDMNEICLNSFNFKYRKLITKLRISYHRWMIEKA